MIQPFIFVRRTAKNAIISGLLALGIAAFAGPSLIRNASASDEATLNGAMLQIEQVEKTLDRTSSAIQTDALHLQPEDGRSLQESLTALRPLADEYFSPLKAIHQISEALELTPDPDLDIAAFTEAADHLDQAFDQIESVLAQVQNPGHDKALDEAERAVRAEKLEQAYKTLLAEKNATPDWAALKSLADTMAAPEIGAEVALTRYRFVLLARAYIARREAGAKRQIPADLSAAAQEMVEESRKSQEKTDGVFERNTALEIATVQMMQALALLSHADLATLQAFYSSGEGRAKRNQLVQAFRSVSDSTAQALFARVLADMNKD
ncbi:hypothetical protein [Roseibium suaedae]|uniref:DUF2059 domain-containing protein n=1 Tax=Roseibium suaedae TaxID=735517 RepID=A0A1M7NQX5_9HYPH|nr:hypothetical protein [Roseibium suaedae]SHN06354.1 hypothetical protein SAMN05444272_3914 [Roseibium suaedae]